MVIFESPIVFGLTFALIGFIALVYLTMTMSEAGVEFTFNVKKAIRRRREWRKEYAERQARGEATVGWAERRSKSSKS
tara:strand:+ start:520 stop:753 length:234 start_codon:yes stop_codon:yes gene_type:complete